MKILVICQYYDPEPFRVSDLCEALTQAGHEVFVVTGTPNYPEGKIYPEYAHGRKKDEVLRGVRIHRCFTVGRRHNVVFRLLNYYSFAISSTLYTAAMRETFDLVFVYQLSPVMMANAALAYKKKFGTKILLYCLDLWPESLSFGGISKNSLIYRYYHQVSERLYRAADRICVSSKSFIPYFQKEFGITDILHLPQYAETLYDRDRCRKIKNETVDLMFAGNVGIAQSPETILYAANQTKDIPNLYWHIVGDGTELERMKQLCRTLDLKNVCFHGRKSVDEMPRYYSMADAMLITMQKSDACTMTLPGKIQAYMAAGKPILGAVDGEAAEVIRESKCGLCCSAEDYQGLAALAMDFAKQCDTEDFSACASAYYRKMYRKEVVVKTLLDWMEQTASDTQINPKS